MNYNPADKEEGSGQRERAKPGVYWFEVLDAAEQVFRSGNEGVKVTLAVAALADRDVKCFEYFVYSPKALWRLENFMGSIGVDFHRPPPVEALMGKKGKALFDLDEKGYLKVERYEVPANNGPETRKMSSPFAAPRAAPLPASGAPKGDDSDCPF